MRHPFRLTAASLSLSLAALSWSAQGQGLPTPPKVETPEAKHAALLLEAQQLQGNKHFMDALNKVDQADKLLPNKPETHNLRGAIYLSSQLRDFDKARAEFQAAAALDPKAMPPRFNLAEADYVQGRYPEAEKGFAGLLEEFPKLPTGARHLMLFKRLVCLARQDKVAEAEKLLGDNFTFMDDTPAYYYSKAVLAFQAKDEKTGNQWLLKGQKIFRKDSSAYLDTLLEGHYLDASAVNAGEGENKDDKK